MIRHTLLALLFLSGIQHQDVMTMYRAPRQKRILFRSGNNQVEQVEQIVEATDCVIQDPLGNCYNFCDIESAHNLAATSKAMHEKWRCFQLNHKVALCHLYNDKAYGDLEEKISGENILALELEKNSLITYDDAFFIFAHTIRKDGCQTISLNSDTKLCKRFDILLYGKFLPSGQPKFLSEMQFTNFGPCTSTNFVFYPIDKTCYAVNGDRTQIALAGWKLSIHYAGFKSLYLFDVKKRKSFIYRMEHLDCIYYKNITFLDDQMIAIQGEACGDVKNEWEFQYKNMAEDSIYVSEKNATDEINIYVRDFERKNYHFLSYYGDHHIGTALYFEAKKRADFSNELLPVEELKRGTVQEIAPYLLKRYPKESLEK